MIVLSHELGNIESYVQTISIRINYIQICNKIIKIVRLAMNEKVSQELFIKVKEKLDYYRLPSTFPIQATHLLNKLIHLIDRDSSNNVFEGETTQRSEGLSAALKHEMARLLKENNKLHKEIMVARQQVQSLQHRLQKLLINKNSSSQELQKLSYLKSQREGQLFQQLSEIRFKYNELMDFLHEDPTAERQYIKRLMKHKHIEAPSQQQHLLQNERIYNKQRNDSSSIRELQTKLKNRENEILRLQSLIQYDGINLNKVIKNFHEDLVKNRLNVADQKINYLEQSYDNIKKQNQNMKNKNGSKEALRAEVEKCHKIIQNLKKDNKDLKRNHVQQNFDVKKFCSQNQRRVEQAKSEKHHAEHQLSKVEQQREQLSKKISFLQKELSETKHTMQKEKEKHRQSSSKIQQIGSKNEQLKVFYEYQIQAYKKRLQETQFELNECVLTCKKIQHQLQIVNKQSQIKSQSISNLEKIVNQLIQKNGILADHGISHTSLKRGDDVESKRHIIDLQQQLLYSANEKDVLEANNRQLEHRFGIYIKQNERFKQDLSRIREDLAKKQQSNIKLITDLDQCKYLLKRQQIQHSRTTSQLNELSFQKQGLIKELKKQNEHLSHQEKVLMLKFKDLEIRACEQQGVLEITKIKLQERDERIRQLQKLLNDTVEQLKEASSQASELEQKNHEIRKEHHKYARKYEELTRQSDQFRNTSFKNYEIAINNNLNQVNLLKKEIIKLSDSQERLTIRYEQVSNLLKMVRRQKEMQEADKINLERQNNHLKQRLLDMQQIQRSLVIENEKLRNAKRMQ